MVDLEILRKIALSLDNTYEDKHFDKISFRINNKIFATYNIKDTIVCIKLSEIDQNVFTSMNKGIFYPVPNRWGKMGWTYIDTSHVEKEIFQDAIYSAYQQVLKKA
ncbi:MAG: MmcQ/YjbR family DNA-binding protein [Saprospiraceae bacterium]